MVDTLKERLISKLAIDDNQCWLYTGYTDELGYGIITHQGGGLKAHRASWIVHKGDIPKDKDVLHKCDVRCCINPDHLFLGTHQDNMRDRDLKGRGANTQGMNHPNVWLTENEVLEIRKLLVEGGLKKWQIAERYKTTSANIYRIEKRLTWRHI